jgi:hypothetical protein
MNRCTPGSCVRAAHPTAKRSIRLDASLPEASRPRFVQRVERRPASIERERAGIEPGDRCACDVTILART